MSMTARSTMTTLLVCALVGSGCNGDKGTDPDDAVCRNYANAYTQAVTGPNGNSTSTVQCGYDTSQNLLTCFYVSQGGVTCNRQDIKYASLADFVDEVQSVPPVIRQVSDTYVLTSSCGSPSRTTNYTYDSQRRLTRATDQASGFSNNYTAWDSKGRATVANNPGPPSTNYTWSYSESTRTQVQTTQASGQTFTATTVYDANGNIASITTVAPAGTFTTTNTGTTAQVCK
jgi:hypothetical protein